MQEVKSEIGDLKAKFHTLMKQRETKDEGQS